MSCIPRYRDRKYPLPQTQDEFHVAFEPCGLFLRCRLRLMSRNVTTAPNSSPRLPRIGVLEYSTGNEDPSLRQNTSLST